MAPNADDTVQSPDDAFAVLGDETRLSILRTLAAAAGPLSFSELQDRVEVRDSGRFNYHLGEATGHFVRRVEEGYVLAPAGRRVIEAVRTGAITDSPEIRATPVDEPCPRCEAPTVIRYHDGRLQHYCTACPGHYGREPLPGEDEECGYLGGVPFPPAGVQGRSPAEAFRAASKWFVLELWAMAERICPRCSARLSVTPRVCERHDAAAGGCDQCHNRHAVQTLFECTNCLYARSGAVVVAILDDPELRAFLGDHGVDPFSPGTRIVHEAPFMEYSEAVRSVAPLDVRLSFTLGGETMTVRVDDSLSTVETVVDTEGD